MPHRSRHIVLEREFEPVVSLLQQLLTAMLCRSVIVKYFLAAGDSRFPSLL